MKKLLLMGTLLTAMTAQAQETKTYYWPDQRQSTITADQDYFIYNTTIVTSNSQDRTFFLYSNGSSLAISKKKPQAFHTANAAHLFQLKAFTPEEKNAWQIVSAHGIVGSDGKTNYATDSNQKVYITSWAVESQITKATDVKSEDTDGTAKDPSATHAWTISKSSEAATPKDYSYAWNGNTDSWSSWETAHPYTFYSVGKTTLSAEASKAFDNLEKYVTATDNKFTMQKAIGLAKDVAQYSSNAQESSEGEISNLIDGNDATFFHSSWSAASPNPDDPHYIQVSLNKEITSFYFYSKKRNDSNRPTDITISVSADGTSFTEIKHLTKDADGLIAANDYTSPQLSNSTPFKYIRFTVNATNTGNSKGSTIKQPYFTYSEFYVFDTEKYDFLNEYKKKMADNSHIKNAVEQQILEDWNTCKDIANSLLKKNITDILTEFERYPFGTELGKFVKPEQYDETVAAAKALNESSTFEEIESVYNQITEVKNAIHIVAPEAGKFYRFKSATQNNYIASNKVGANNRPLMTAAPEEAVFYLTADSKLITSNMLAMDNYNVVANLGQATTFKASKAIIGAYAIRNNGGSYFAKATGEQIDRHGDENTGLATADCAWILEEVTDPAVQPKLTKTMTAEYATLAAPVALNIPAGVKAYTVTVDEAKETAILNEVADVIPAGVAVLLKKEGAENSFDFTYAPEGATENENALVGVYKETAVGSDINAYILGNGSKGLGFYQMDKTDRTLGANKAYLVLPKEAQAIRSIIIGGPTTGIEETVAESTGAEEYYDLQGRRVMNPTKGIYVTKSGKKVIFNK